MSGAEEWTFPVFPGSDLDRQVLQLCSPAGAAAFPETVPAALLERAAALDVFPLVFHRLRQSRPLDFAAETEWDDRFRANAARNLFLHTEQRRLLARLAEAGVTAAPLKGTTLAERAYGDLALRTQVDVDFYVPPPHLPKALAALGAAGYEWVAPAGVPPERLAATGDAFSSECSLVSTRSSLPVLLELHWHLLPGAEGAVRAALDSRPGPLPPELNLLYLSLKAAAARWGTLKLLVDIAHCLAREPLGWEAVLDHARQSALRRVLYITLAALQNYFAVEVPPAVRAELEPARPRRLPAGSVASPFAPVPALSPAATHRLRFALRERLRDRLGYALFLLRPTARELASLRLPRPLGFLYWGLRWLRVAGLWKGTLPREPLHAGRVS